MSAPTDFLSRVQLSAVSILNADSFFSTAPAIPVVSEVMGDITSLVSQRAQKGLCCIVGLDSTPVDQNGGGHLTISQGRLIVRVREVVGVNRSAAGYKETALTVAQAAVLALHNQRAVDENGTAYAGVFFSALSLEPAMPDDIGGDPRNVVAWHATFKFVGGLRTISRRADPPAAGGM